MQASLGKKFVAALVADGTVATLLKHTQLDYLLTPTELPAYEFVIAFSKEYGKVPSAVTIEAHTQDELTQPEELAAYYRDLLELRWIERELKRDMKSAAELLGVDGKDAPGALDIMRQCVAKIIGQQHKRVVSDFRDAYDVIVPDYVAKYNGADGDGVNTGWPTLDAMTGGLVAGNLVSLVGKIARGKTWAMLYGCHHGWHVQGLPQMFVSMEMPPLEIHQRLTAMHAKIPAKKVADGELSSIYAAKMKSTLIEVQGAKSPLWVIDGNFESTVEDIWMLARQLKPASIWIDGGYLLKHPTEKDRYRRVAENAEAMKQQLAREVPVVCSWQFAKSDTKKKAKSEKAEMEDIGYAYAIPQVSSIVLALLESESAETVKSRVVDILKGRKGEIGSFRTNWDFVGMDFSEIEMETVEELQFT